MSKNVTHLFLKILINTIGQTSNGIRLCTEHGFTSGKMLDYIYQNKPSGKFLIGKLLDRIFIRHNGWEVVRIRKNNLVNFLHESINSILVYKNEVYIVDVASGPAGYVLEVMNKYTEKNIFATCRDLETKWLEEGQRKAKTLNIKNIEFKSGNALDTDSFKQLEKTPDIMISSGFYDWITDDELIKKSMQIVYDTLYEGGYFIFTNQSGHFNLEMMSDLFKDFNKDPLNMTVRDAQLVNAWAKEIGFNILKTISDQSGFYSVTLAQK